MYVFTHILIIKMNIEHNCGILFFDEKKFLNKSVNIYCKKCKEYVCSLYIENNNIIRSNKFIGKDWVKSYCNIISPKEQIILGYIKFDILYDKKTKKQYPIKNFINNAGLFYYNIVLENDNKYLIKERYEYHI